MYHKLLKLLSSQHIFHYSPKIQFQFLFLSSNQFREISPARKCRLYPRFQFSLKPIQWTYQSLVVEWYEPSSWKNFHFHVLRPACNLVHLSRHCTQNITGWWLTYPSEKYESQLGWIFPIYGKIKHDPNHRQPENKYNSDGDTKQLRRSRGKPFSGISIAMFNFMGMN